MSRIHPLRRIGARCELLDQRALPEQERWIPLATPEDAAVAIADMVVRGAPAIGITAAWGLALLGERAAETAAWETATAQLAASRPTAVNLAWAIGRMGAVRTAHCGTPAELAAALCAEAAAIEAEDLAMCRHIGNTGAAAILGNGLRVLTHCNAGALATAGWGTALGVVRQLAAEGRLAHVLANETRPYWQGARLTAWELLADGIPVHLLPDAAAGAALATGLVDVVVVGADRIAADGAVANKIGTYLLAVLANRHGVPFYVAAPRSTVDLACPNGAAIPIEERAAEELTHVHGRRIAAAGVLVWNPAFDVTPPDLITALILDGARIRGGDAAALAAFARSSD